MPITDWPSQERPREKLLLRGATALSDAELLAIFLRTGVAGETAVDLARKLLHEFGGLRQLLGAIQKTDIQFLANVYQKMLKVVMNGLLKALNEYAAKINLSNEQYFVNFLISREGTYTPTSMEDFAHILHIEVRTLQRIIKKLTEKKIIQKSNKTIQIIDMESAKEIVGF